MKLAGVTLNQFLKIGLIASVFIIFLKWVATKVPVPGLQAAAGAAFLHNLPPEGTYVQDTDQFFVETEKNIVPQAPVALSGLGAAPIDQRIPNNGILAKIRVVFKGSLVVTTPTGTCTPTYKWPW